MSEWLSPDNEYDAVSAAMGKLDWYSCSSSQGLSNNQKLTPNIQGNIQGSPNTQSNTQGLSYIQGSSNIQGSPNTQGSYPNIQGNIQGSPNTQENTQGNTQGLSSNIQGLYPNTQGLSPNSQGSSNIQGSPNTQGNIQGLYPNIQGSPNTQWSSNAQRLYPNPQGNIQGSSSNIQGSYPNTQGLSPNAQGSPNTQGNTQVLSPNTQGLNTQVLSPNTQGLNTQGLSPNTQGLYSNTQGSPNTQGNTPRLCPNMQGSPNTQRLSYSQGSSYIQGLSSPLYTAARKSNFFPSDSPIDLLSESFLSLKTLTSSLPHASKQDASDSSLLPHQFDTSNHPQLDARSSFSQCDASGSSLLPLDAGSSFPQLDAGSSFPQLDAESSFVDTPDSSDHPQFDTLSNLNFPTSSTKNSALSTSTTTTPLFYSANASANASSIPSSASSSTTKATAPAYNKRHSSPNVGSRFFNTPTLQRPAYGSMDYGDPTPTDNSPFLLFQSSISSLTPPSSHHACHNEQQLFHNEQHAYPNKQQMFHIQPHAYQSEQHISQDNQSTFQIEQQTNADLAFTTPTVNLSEHFTQLSLSEAPSVADSARRKGTSSVTPLGSNGAGRLQSIWSHNNPTSSSNWNSQHNHLNNQLNELTPNVNELSSSMDEGYKNDCPNLDQSANLLDGLNESILFSPFLSYESAGTDTRSQVGSADDTSQRRKTNIYSSKVNIPTFVPSSFEFAPAANRPSELDDNSHTDSTDGAIKETTSDSSPLTASSSANRRVVSSTRLPSKSLLASSSPSTSPIRDIVIQLPPSSAKSPTTSTLPEPCHMEEVILRQLSSTATKYHERYCSTFYKRNKHKYMFIKESSNSLKVNQASSKDGQDTPWVTIKIKLHRPNEKEGSELSQRPSKKKLKVDVRDLPVWKPINVNQSADFEWGHRKRQRAKSRTGKDLPGRKKGATSSQRKYHGRDERKSLKVFA